MSENTVLRKIWLAIGMMSRVFRLHSGVGWVPTRGSVYKLDNGDVVVPGGRPMPFGFGDPSGHPVPGPHDLVGWTTITITPEMVGCDVAVFTGIEAKSDSTAKKRGAQKTFGQQVREAGGISGFAHTPEMAVEIVKGFTPIRRKA